MRISRQPGLLMLMLVIAGLSAVKPVSAGPAAPVTVVTVKQKPLIETVPLTGTVTSERSSALSPRISGLVAAVHVDAGDRVEQGETLIQLDTELAELALARAQAAVTEARARLDEAIRLRDEARKLAASRNIPETRLRASEAEVEISRAALERLQVEVREQHERLQRHAVIAPFNAVVSRKLTEAGEWVNTGTAVLELVETQRLRLDVQAPQHLYRAISEGMPVQVRLDGMPDQTLDGRVRARVPVNDPSARTFLVRIDLDDPDAVLTPGMSARALFRIDSDTQGLVLPRDAIVRLPDGTTNVWVINRDDAGQTSASRLQIKLGKIMADRVEIKSGLSAGQQVVLRGNEVLNDGQKVRIIENE